MEMETKTILLNTGCFLLLMHSYVITVFYISKYANIYGIFLYLTHSLEAHQLLNLILTWVQFYRLMFLIFIIGSWSILTCFFPYSPFSVFDISYFVFVSVFTVFQKKKGYVNDWDVFPTVFIPMCALQWSIITVSYVWLCTSSWMRAGF